jgi:hypothetical protein
MNQPTLSLLLSLLCSASLTANAAPVDEVVTRVINAYGGMAEWSSAESVSETGRVTSTMRATDSPIARSFQYPATLRVEIGRENGAEIRTLKDGHGWKNDAEVTGPQLDAMLLQAARMGLPRLLADPTSNVKDNGEVERDGKKYRELEVELPNKMSLVVQIDRSDWHIVRSIGRAPTPQFGTGTIEFVTDYLDFRLVDGLLFSFHEINYAQGTKTGETKLEKIHVARTGTPAHPDTGKPRERT